MILIRAKAIEYELYEKRKKKKKKKNYFDEMLEETNYFSVCYVVR
jgi:hypothetical protein